LLSRRLAEVLITPYRRGKCLKIGSALVSTAEYEHSHPHSGRL
jgi:hypothetical protein